MKKIIWFFLMIFLACISFAKPAEIKKDKAEKQAVTATKDEMLKNVIVYQESGKFCGWPANNGLWSWGDEIVVGYSLGHYEAKDKGHSINRDKPSRGVLSRSVDGGETWTLETPNGFVSEKEAVACPGGIDFTRSGFALRCRRDTFMYSYDRCKSWSEAYQLPQFGQKGIMPRTDYIINGKDDCMIFLTAQKTNGKEGRPFIARTTDGGKTINFVSWISDEPEGFSIMPSTVRVSKNELITAIRRKEKGLGFIEIYASNDNGISWSFLSKPAETGRGNGNPAAMIKLRDGRIALTYGYRSEPQGMRAMLSRDNGKSWGREIMLRADGRTWDLGYPRTLQRSDGKIVTIYYYTTEKNPEQHIAATIWSPELGS
jgi:hypothetical protein